MAIGVLVEQGSLGMHDVDAVRLGMLAHWLGRVRTITLTPPPYWCQRAGGCGGGSAESAGYSLSGSVTPPCRHDSAPARGVLHSRHPACARSRPRVSALPGKTANKYKCRSVR